MADYLEWNGYEIGKIYLKWEIGNKKWKEDDKKKVKTSFKKRSIFFAGYILNHRRRNNPHNHDSHRWKFIPDEERNDVARDILARLQGKSLSTNHETRKLLPLLLLQLLLLLLLLPVLLLLVAIISEMSANPSWHFIFPRERGKKCLFTRNNPDARKASCPGLRNATK